MNYLDSKVFTNYSSRFETCGSNNFPYFLGLRFVRGRSLYIRAGDPSVQGQPLVRVTTAAEASRETTPAVSQYDAKRRLECRRRSLGF